MYHSAGKPISNWGWSFLTVPHRVFESHLIWLAREGFQAVDLDDVYSHVTGAKALEARSVVLTFDDGLLDNWVYAIPLLKQYGFKATVFVNPEFVDPRPIIRPTLEDVQAGRMRDEELEVRGFMSWEEMRSAARMGVLSVESHLMTHTWYPVNDSVVDFHHPGDNYYWLTWNKAPEEKPFYLNKLDREKIPWGFPVYSHAKAMEATIFFPDKREGMYLCRFVEENGEAAFFECSDWRERLHAEVRQFRATRNLRTRYETAEERLKRLTFELQESKRVIEENLGSAVNFLAWPGGGYDQESISLASGFYRATTISSSDQRYKRTSNRTGDDPSCVKRIGVPNIEIGTQFLYPGGRYLVQFLEEYTGVGKARRRRQLLKMGYILAARARRLR